MQTFYRYFMTDEKQFRTFLIEKSTKFKIYYNRSLLGDDGQAKLQVDLNLDNGQCLKLGTLESLHRTAIVEQIYFQLSSSALSNLAKMKQ